ncbi:hypothetical protein F4801DRAFT_558144 [Xylaria longipes]|nr:hypothetical protein F4801DRAFT_558144 [Xylaria longipes]
MLCWPSRLMTVPVTLWRALPVFKDASMLDRCCRSSHRHVFAHSTQMILIFKAKFLSIRHNKDSSVAGPGLTISLTPPRPEALSRY